MPNIVHIDPHNTLHARLRARRPAGLIRQRGEHLKRRVPKLVNGQSLLIYKGRFARVL